MSKNKNILIVEDEMLVAVDLELLLKKEGYNVLGIINSGEEAIKRSIELQPDLVLLDITLSDNVSGFDVASVLRFHQIPIVFITATNLKQKQSKITESETFGFIMKPFNNDELLVTIEIALSKDKKYKKLLESEEKYRTLFVNMQTGLAYYKVVLDEQGAPIDIIFLEINGAFEKLTGLVREKIIGKRMSDILSVSKNALTALIEIFSKVSLTGESSQMENYIEDLDKHFRINVYSPKRGYFTTIIEDITTRKLAVEKLNRAHEELHNLTIYMDTKVEEEEKKIARNLHEGLGQLLTAIKINLSLLCKNHSDGEKFMEKIESINEMLDSSIQLVQNITKELRSVVLDDLGIIAAIQSRLLDFEETSGIKTIFTYYPQDVSLDPDLLITIYKIFLEIYTNIIRHAKTEKVVIKLRKFKTSLTLYIRDFGIGITSEQISSSLSFGLIGIRERLTLWNGTMNVVGISGKGTTIKIRVHLSNTIKSNVLSGERND